MLLQAEYKSLHFTGPLQSRFLVIKASKVPAWWGIKGLHGVSSFPSNSSTEHDTTRRLCQIGVRLRNDLYCVEWGVKLYSLLLSNRRNGIWCLFELYTHALFLSLRRL